MVRNLRLKRAWTTVLLQPLNGSTRSMQQIIEQNRPVLFPI